MAFLELLDISKHFGHTAAVDNIGLSIKQGEFLTLLGPSGCGKTTLLRMIAGFETPTTGSILLDGEDITNRPANKRLMGMVFQSYALFPHMSAQDNIGFGMTIKHQPKHVIKKRTAELLELVGLAEMGQRYPHQLSGGQQQRIALARALAVEPKVLLLDEPLSALDAKVRISLRNEIRRIQQELKITAIYVTHDQEEALSLSDRIAVMAKGKIEQLDAPENIYNQPQTAFAATFVGNSNQFNGIIESAANGLCQVGTRTLNVSPLSQFRDGERVLIMVRPEDIAVQVDEDTHDDLNVLAGRIDLRTFLGPFTRLHVSIDETTTLLVDIPTRQAASYTPGRQVHVSFPPQACKVLALDAKDAELVHLAAAEAV
ncbi:ABC transporter ATP-binding protein [Ktedonobacter racemifer]|uniref:Spermidine/putrescine import ATP-binding protein PotA n=1 Tax=Ktedonobacter racemifer DSM 44963 TaxID=485913 RepID=D6TTD6_KTERA|nr:ABC transporter ATP-binding protein [Ktedonobacter racemifer]EFH83687.1 spermidine/putrescine ABC transporter ATPase subunit [Ktedonobacter racemifer DSM 44963]